MNVIATAPGLVKSLRQSANGSFQRTFATPLQQLPVFVSAIFPNDAPLRSASAVVETVVFEPKHLEALLAAHSLATNLGHDWTIAAAGHEESTGLLEALLGDWLDFYFAPVPKQLLVYADHDEYTTLFAARKGPLSRAADRLISQGVREIVDYTREV